MRATLQATLRDASGNAVATSRGDTDFAFEELPFAGRHLLDVYCQERTGPSENYTLNLDASVVAATRPDVAVGTTATVSIGAGVDLPSGQSVTLTSRLARPVTGYASVANRGNLPDDLAGRASGGNAFFKVAYFDLTRNVTAGLLAGTYRTPELESSDAAVPIRVPVTPNKRKLTRRQGTRTIILKKNRNLTITATSTFEPSIQDAASIRVQTR